MRKPFTISLLGKGGGVSEKTLLTYGQHFSAVSKHLSPDTPMDALNKAKLEDMISSMRDAGLAANSIKSYTRTLKSFLTRPKKPSRKPIQTRN